MFLLDTHPVLWAAYAAERLSPKASRLLRSRETSLAFSLASLWEVTIKTSLGRAGSSVEPQDLHQARLTQGDKEVGIRAPHLVSVASLAWIHRDPIDRLLVARAIEDGLTPLTADAALKRCGRIVKLV